MNIGSSMPVQIGQRTSKGKLSGEQWASLEAAQFDEMAVLKETAIFAPFTAEELVATAEQLGFDAIVAGQHFLGSELRYYQPVPYLLYLGQFAPTMRLVIGVLLLSIVNPVEAETVPAMRQLQAYAAGADAYGRGEPAQPPPTIPRHRKDAWLKGWADQQAFMDRHPAVRKHKQKRKK